MLNCSNMVTMAPNAAPVTPACEHTGPSTTANGGQVRATTPHTPAEILMMPLQRRARELLHRSASIWPAM